jgi:hypothetical protein
MAKIRSRKRLRASVFALPKQRKYPIPDAAHARNAIARVAKAPASVKAKVYAAVRRKFPALAKRSTVIPTSSGTGRHYGDPKGKTHRR